MALPTLRRNGNLVPVRQTGPVDSNLSRIDPWNDFGMMSRIFDRLTGNPFSVFGPESARWLDNGDSNLELYENNDELLAFVAIPGVQADSFDVSANEDSVTIKAERKPYLEATEGLVSHNAWRNTATAKQTFSTTCSLPAQIDPARVSAMYKDGVLQIKMPKSQATKPTHIKVDVGG